MADTNAPTTTERQRVDHTVLYNQDILLRIFEHFPLDPHDEQINCSTRTHLLWGALTCQAFLEPALNVLWRSMVTFIPLLKLLPAFQLVQGEYVIRGTISAADWERFYRYAGKVREFTYPGFQEDNRISHHAKFRLAQLWQSPLLPALRRYNCYDVRSLGPFIHSLFISPTTEHLALGFITDAQDSAVGTVLSMLAEDAQSLKTLSLGGSLSTPSLAYVLQLKNLQSLELRSMGDSIDSHFFKMVADLEKLVDLTIDLYNSPSSTFPAGQGFKRLKKLHITAFFSVIEDILLDLSDEVELESLGFFAPPAPLPMGWETQCTSLFSTVHQRWPQSMRRICIDREWSNLICLPMSLSLIAPLLRIPNIEYFSVREFFLPISNEELGELASSWPSLQELHLPFDDNVAPQISFSMLYTLAALCPRLLHLEMPIDFKEIPPLPNPRPKPVALERLYIANDNPPNETSELLLIARHFDRLFPRLQKLGRLQLKDLEIATWDKVLAMIHAFRSVRLES